jgi:hypothetical protein
MFRQPWNRVWAGNSKRVELRDKERERERERERKRQRENLNFSVASTPGPCANSASYSVGANEKPTVT